MDSEAIGNKQLSRYRRNCNCPNGNKNRWRYDTKVSRKQNNKVILKNPPIKSATKMRLVKFT